MISDCISGDIPPQMKILNMVVPILMHFCSFELELCKPHIAACNPTKCHIIIDVTISESILQDILLQIFDVIQSNVALQKQVH